ncbi:MAG: flavodoxin domain-containing protein, partial [Candidatus Caldatribacteriaceae bacterium]
DFLKKHWPVLQKKNLIVFATAGTPSAGPKEEKIMEKNLPREARGKVACFPLPGAYSYQKLDWKDRLLMEEPRLMLLLRFYIKKDPQALQHLRNFSIPQDWTTREALRPLLAFLAAQTRI